MISDSGRIGEFKDDCHYWPCDPSAEQLRLWVAPQSKSERVENPAETAHELLVGIQFENKHFQIPINIKKEEND